MNLPSHVIAIVSAAVERHHNDIPAAVNESEKRIRKLADFPELVDGLVRSAIQDAVYERRHTVNVANKRQAGQYGQPGKVKTGTSQSLGAVKRSVYQYYIAGRTLGTILGGELRDIAANEDATAAGYTFRAQLCRRLADIVPAEKTVREAVTEKKLRTLFRELGAVQETAAA